MTDGLFMKTLGIKYNYPHPTKSMLTDEMIEKIFNGNPDIYKVANILCKTRSYQQAERWLKKGVALGDEKCLRLLGSCYIQGNIPGGVLKGAKCLIKAKANDSIRIRLCVICELEECFAEYITYGHAIMLGKIQIETDAVDLYKKVAVYVKKGLLYFLWMTKNVLCKDVQQMIGKIIWKGRFQIKI